MVDHLDLFFHHRHTPGKIVVLPHLTGQLLQPRFRYRLRLAVAGQHTAQTQHPRDDRYDDRYRLLSFPDWSGEIVFSDRKKNLYRRKQVLQLLANQDGGAHVDPEISDDLAVMKTNDLTGWTVTRPDGTESPLDNDAVYATMRQMTFEVLQSLYRVKPKLFPEIYF